MEIQKPTWTFETVRAHLDQLSLSKSPKTIASYWSDLKSFINWLDGLKMRKPSSLTAEHIMSYLGFQKAQGKSDATLCRYYMSLRSYLRFLRRSGLIKDDLTEALREISPQCKQKAPRIPTTAEMEHMLTLPDTETEAGTRDKAILELLYSSGLRASELCDLELRDWKGDSVLVHCGKRDKTRTVPMTETASSCINRYVEMYRGRQQGLLFVTAVHKKGIRSQFLSGMVGRYAKQANLEGVTTHTLRHACATHLLDKGADLRMIQEVLGHATIASTTRYTHLSSAKIQQMFTQFHPRGNS